jgi:hypothetical protein
MLLTLESKVARCPVGRHKKAPGRLPVGAETAGGSFAQNWRVPPARDNDNADEGPPRYS